MEKNDIKKALYKQNPKAKLIQVTKEILNYTTELEGSIVVRFLVPITDIGDASFFPEMDAKLLIRYMI
jgi:hypothetical protein